MKKTANSVDRMLPRPPKPDEFVATLEKYLVDLQKGPAVDPIHGTLLANVLEEKPKGTAIAERVAVTRLLEFQQVCKHLNAQYEDLDGFFSAWAGWVIDPRYLFDEATLINQAEQQRRAQCGTTFKFETYLPSTVRGHFNSLARVFTSVDPDGTLVPSSKKQFPQLNRLMTSALTRESSRKAVGTAAHPPVEVLQDEEPCWLPWIGASLLRANVQTSSFWRTARGTGPRVSSVSQCVS
eukprot:EG_transcript_15018